MLTINISELALTVVSFFLMLFVLDRLLFRPLLRFMEARQAKIDAGLKLGSDADEAVRRAKGESEGLLAESRKLAAQTVTQAGLEDQRNLAEAAKLLVQETESAAETTQSEVRTLRERSAAGLESMRPQLTELLADRLLGR